MELVALPQELQTLLLCRAQAVALCDTTTARDQHGARPRWKGVWSRTYGEVRCGHTKEFLESNVLPTVREDISTASVWASWSNLDPIFDLIHL